MTYPFIFDSCNKIVFSPHKTSKTISFHFLQASWDQVPCGGESNYTLTMRLKSLLSQLPTQRAVRDILGGLPATSPEGRGSPIGSVHLWTLFQTPSCTINGVPHPYGAPSVHSSEEEPPLILTGLAFLHSPKVRVKAASFIRTTHVTRLSIPNTEALCRGEAGTAHLRPSNSLQTHIISSCFLIASCTHGGEAKKTTLLGVPMKSRSHI